MATAHWDPGEAGHPKFLHSAVPPPPVFDPNMKNTYTLQGTAYLERQVAQNFSVRSGFVWNGPLPGSAPRVSIWNRPISAYNLATPVRDPGPDGKAGTADDGSLITAFGLSPAYLNLPVVNITTNLPENSNYYTGKLRPSNVMAAAASRCSATSRRTRSARVSPRLRLVLHRQCPDQYR